MRSEPRKQAAFRIESSGYTLDGVAPGRKSYCREQTSCFPSHGHGPRHSAWEGCRTMHLYQELSLGSGRIALHVGLPRLLIARPPLRPKRSHRVRVQGTGDIWMQYGVQGTRNRALGTGDAGMHRCRVHNARAQCYTHGNISR